MKNAMGSQTLDIFRQGVWASLTGGWFYDPNQGVFCNAVHLYIWLFFLCGPFFTYLYSPTFIAWIVYVSATATTMTVLKAVNMGLHFVYDQSHMLSEASPNGTTKCKENSGDCNGIEMQILDNTQSAISENRMFERDITDSIASLDCGNNNNSTIDFKVDVHRKNSSGSNESVSLYASEILASTYGAKSKSDASSQPKMRKYENNGIARNEVLYLCPLKSAISEEGTASSVGCSPVDDHVCDESKCKQTVNSILNDSEADASHWNVINVDPQMPTRLRRSTRSGISDEIKKLSMSPKNTHNNSKTASEDLHLFTGSKYGESDLEIENLDRRFLQQCEHMQKAQSGTISTLHLPSVTFNNSKTYKRRHSNACSKSAAAASVIGGGVRRIKSAAHDISHLQTSVTNLPSYPNSIEVIPERPVKNSTGGPMQSKLTRNTYMNFCSKMDGLAEVGNALCEEDYYHPKSIAERNIFGERNVFGEKDNMACSMTTSSGKCVKKINKLGKKCCSIAESDLCRPQTESTGSESEINGSSSPLLNESKFLDANDSEPLGQNSCELGTQYKTEDSGCPSSDCEQTSEGSKDMLLSKDESSSNLKSVISMDFDRKMQHGDEKQCENPQPAQFSSISKDLSKNLGAVPKVLKRYDEPAPIPNRSVSLKGVFHRSLSCDSSSESSRSFSRENVSGHIYRPNNDQWLLQGGPKRSFRVSSARLPLVYTNDVAFGCRPGHGMIEDGMKIAPILRSTESKGEDDLLDEQLEFSKTLDASTSETRQSEPDMPLSIPDFIQFQYQEQLSMRRPSEDTNLNTSDRQFSDPAYCDYWQPCNLAKAKPVPQKRCYKYRLKYFGTKELEISMDRLQLLAIFDRDLNWFHVLLSIVLSTIVCFLGSVVLNLGVYRDICAFIFCLVIASSQYSLLKSVQPDAASPVHGFNKTVAYSRPIYFCLFCGLLLASHYTLDEIQNNELQQYPRTVQIFGITLIVESFCEIMEYSLSIFLLAFPILFSLGLFPQFNTFCMYLLEQIDLHMFGGNAACNLSASILCVVKSILAVCILYGPIFGGLSEEKGTQHVLFSIFCGALISSSYHLSRCTSDFSHIWTLITSNLLKYTEEEEDGDRKSESHRNESDSKNSPRSEKIEDSKENVESSDKGNIMRKRAASSEVEQMDPFIKTFQNTVNSRLKNDLVVCTSIGLLFLALHATTVFTVLQPNLSNVLLSIAIGVGFLLHYLIPQMRKHLPWLCFAHPILKQREYGKFEVGEASQIMWFERLYIYVCFIEKNILYPLIFISALTAESTSVVSKFGLAYASLIVTVCALKAVRSSYSDSTNQYLILVFCWLFFKFDFKLSSETFILDYFVVSIIYRKFCDFLLKVQFVVTYIAPWQITWGSAFHAFAQPFSVPHSAMLFLQASVSAVLSTPLNPFLGSAIFLTSYVRPIKFWERDYNTRRIDHSNTRLSSQLEKDLGADDNNLNSIFYEHLTRSLQHYLCGDLLLGRWGNVNQGDCFVLASDYLNCLVHIIELGNGLCTFQMRGLEFRGTYCQQREVEAISEGVEDDRGCCCCSPGHMPHMLSVNAMFSTRWLAWQVVAAQYVLEGYSISENLATATLQLFEFRKVLITYYVKSIIYYVTQSNKLDEWLAPGPIQEALGSTLSRQFVDLDPIFNYNLDEDFDFRALGITRGSFCCVYLNWIQFCYAKRLAERNMNLNASRKASESCENSESAPSANSSKNFRGNTKNYAEDRPNSENGGSNESGSNGGGSPIGKDSPLVSLCLALGLLARRSLATASHSSLSGVEFFLHGLHALFKGDFRITSPRDEWVFADMELLHGVVAPAVKMGLKLHQDHFSSPDEYLDEAVLYDAIKNNSTQLVISHEADPMWRSAVLRGAPNLLALRHVMEDGCDEYRIIRLTKRFLSFRVIKLNRECVRGLWAGQQQELIYLRNRNPERGSIQNAKQALRNIINSSCDQPIGYPIYVSPLTTSYAETNEQLTQVIGGSLTLDSLQNLLVTYWKRIRNRFQEGCSSGSSVVEADTTTTTTTMMANTCVTHTPGQSGGSMILTRSNQSFPGSTLRTGLTSVNKPTNSALLVGFLNREREQDRESVRDRLTKRSVQLRNVTELNNLSDGMPMLKDFGENPGISRYRQISHPDEICSSAFTSASTSCSGKFTESGEHNILNGLPDGTEQLLVEINKKVIIVNQMEIYDCLDLGRRIDVVWPNEKMRLNGGRSSWKGWFPEEGMVGFVVHYWQPNHPDQRFRSNVNRTLYLVAIEDRFVPVGADGIREYKQIGFTDFTSTPLPLPPPPPLATESKQIVDDTEI